MTLGEIDPLDPADEAPFQAWIEVHEAAARAAYGELHTAWSAQEIRAFYRHEAQHVRRIALGAVVQGEVVGAAEVQLQLADNTDRAELVIAVHPDHRRGGIGTALLARCEQIAVDDGRHVLGGESDIATELADPAIGFAAAHGYTNEQTELRSDLLLPVDESQLAALEADAAVRGAGYSTLTSWDGIPDEWLADRAELSRRMSTDVPLGGVEYGEEKWDADRVRTSYEVARAQGRRVVETVARHDASGTLVAFTQLGVASHTPTVGYQWDTLVLAEHRGHRLGQLVKVANLRALLAELPGMARVATWNAAENAPMLRVNRALGFQTTGRLTEWQKRLP